jgi:oligopeptide/dipeptide ABC transporter ATP-binding protein
VTAPPSTTSGTGTVSGALVEARGIVKHFPIRKGILRRVQSYARAVDGVDFAILPGQTLGLVGESGSGKSTLGRCVLRLLKIDGGDLKIAGRDITKLSRRELRITRRNAQMIFQDPYSSFDPRSTVQSSITEPLRAHESMSRRQREERASELVTLVGLGAQHLQRYPYQFSGGQLQRLAIARALAINPQLVVCDEPVSSLDVSTQAQVINLMRELQRDLGVAYLFIAHDLSVVRHVSDRIAVMYLGRIVEQGPAETVYTSPKHPYTEALLSAVPVPDPVVQRSRQRIVLSGDVPSPVDPPSGCRFHTRCPFVMEVCRTVDPEAMRTPDGTTVACHLHTTGPTLAGETVRSLRVSQ